jgi:hypothetical protein
VTDANYVIGAVMVGTLVITWTLGRVVERLREPLSVVNAVVFRTCFGLVLALVAAQAAVQGGFWLLLVPALALLGLWNFALTAGLIWAWTTEEASGSS